MRLSPVLDALGTYPFVRLRDARRARDAAGLEVIDFGAGEPREESPAFVRRALADALEPIGGYPAAEGLPELRSAIAAWVGRRFGASLDPAAEVVPTLGSKEVISSLAQICGPGGVAVTTPGYPVAARGALLAGREVVELPLHASGDFLPDLDATDFSALALLWVNYPNNPTAATAPLGFYEELLGRAREHGVLVASDEAYSELFFGDDAPVSALSAHDRRGLLVVNTLSKRSSMPGFRSGFAAGDPELIAALKRFRPNVGTAPQEFVQRAAIAAWGDEEHVDAVRARYRAKRDVLLPALESIGLREAGGDATFFLWLALPDGESSAAAFAKRLLAERGVLVAPGTIFGAAGEGYVRVALVPTPEQCARAADLLSA